MSQRFFTVLVLRHSRARFRRVQLSYTFAISVALLAGLLLAGGLLAPGLFLDLQTQSVTLDRLQHENAKLWSEKDQFEGVLNQMAQRIESFEERTRQIALELGNKDLQAARTAAGGGFKSTAAGERFPFEGELRYLEARTESLDRSFDAMQERVEVLRATPSGMPVRGWFSHGYGWRKDPWSGQREFHRGIDLVADSGVEIVAPADGVVSRVGRYPDYGNSLDLDHGSGYVTRYAHMSEVLVQPGERVERGQVIGKVGSSGRSTGPHLHYEVLREGRQVNPWSYLDAEGG